MLIALLGVFAFSAVAVAAAQAEEAPFWSIGGTRLAAGQTHFITGKSYKETSFTALGVTTSCPTVTVKEGVLLGSNAGEPGTNDEILEFGGGCTVVGNGTGCKVEVEPIVTRPVKSELVETEKGEKGSLLTEFFPNKGSAFTTIKLTAACTKVREITAEGSLAGQVLTDPNNGTLGELVTLPNTKKEGTSWLLNFPATQIESVWLIKGGVGSQVPVGLKAATEPAKFEGTALVLLANSKRESVEEKWSPLP
jgi:hypothetical protein